MLSHVLTLLSLASSLVVASPIGDSNAEPGSFKLRGRANGPDLYTFENGTINLDFVLKAVQHAKEKYSRQPSEYDITKRAFDANSSVEDTSLAEAKRSLSEREPSRNRGKRAGRPSGPVVVASSVNVPLNSYDSSGPPAYDIFYYGAGSFGSASQELPLLMDTGSSDLWVPVVAGTGTAGYFNTTASTTFVQTSKTFAINYASGSSSGRLAYDRFSLSPTMSVPQQYFGAVTTVSSDFVNGPEAGILGLAFQSIAQTGQPTIIQNLWSQGLLKNNLFAMHLSRATSSGAELSIGAVDTTQFRNPILYTPVTQATYWEVKAVNLFVGGTLLVTSYNAVIDSGTTLMYFPTYIAAAIYTQIPRSSVYSTSGGILYQIPCSGNPIVALKFSGINTQYSINGNDLVFAQSGTPGMCIGSIVGATLNDLSGQPIAILGGAFMKSVYTVFNYNVNGKPAVGFSATG